VTASTRPQLVTSSYAAYRRPMGALVRITLGVPRGVKLPDPRFGEFTHWPSIPELAPKRDYWSAPDAEFARRYLDQLDQAADVIDVKLRTIHPAADTLVLCCFERRVASSADCHRRLAAAWLEERFSMQIPEMDPAPGGCR
jgi:hypothetical protein